LIDRKEPPFKDAIDINIIVAVVVMVIVVGIETVVTAFLCPLFSPRASWPNTSKQPARPNADNSVGVVRQVNSGLERLNK
jgi:hypothetical protein